jgi:hypothetical protein
VSGHIPKLLGTWGLSTIILGKSVSQEIQAKGRKFVWVGTTSFLIVNVVHEKRVEGKKRGGSWCI